MRNNQLQLQIYYNLRVREKEINIFKKINNFAEKSVKESKGAQYNV